MPVDGQAGLWTEAFLKMFGVQRTAKDPGIIWFRWGGAMD